MTDTITDRTSGGEPEANATRACTCHPDDNPPNPCPQKYALTHCRAAAIAKALRVAIVTATNDEWSERGSTGRQRHLDRLDAMMDAAEFLEQRY